MLRKLLLLLLLPACSFAFQRGAVISYELIETNTLQQMQDGLASQGIPVDNFGCRFGVKVYRVHYQTITPLGDSTSASGALMIPTGNMCSMPMANYSHGTVLDRYSVPSYLSYESQIGKLFGCRGIVVTMPDYLGLGMGTGLHPYVHAKSEASATIDMMRATRLLQTELGFALNDQLFLFGYSQGGHACMATHREIEQFHAAEFTVTASAPMSGPYDISGVQAQYLINDEPYSSPAYLPYVIYSYKEYYPVLFDTVSYIFAPPYDVLLPPYFDGTASFSNANVVCAPIPNDMILPAVFNEFLTMPDHPFWVALRDNDVYDWIPQAPVRMYYCEGDEQVEYHNALVAKAAFDVLGPNDVEAISLSTTLDHTGCVTFALLSGNTFFNQYIDLSNGMSLEAAITDHPGSPGVFDVALNVTGGVPPYTYAWDFGDDAAIIAGLDAGFYPVTITDATGCGIYQNLNVTAANTTGLSHMQATSAVRIWPNPATNQVIVVAPTATTVVVQMLDMTGRLALSLSVSGNTLLDLSPLPAGVYTLNATSNGVHHATRLVKL